jgi:hypothetical protein
VQVTTVMMMKTTMMMMIETHAAGHQNAAEKGLQQTRCSVIALSQGFLFVSFALAVPHLLLYLVLLAVA